MTEPRRSPEPDPSVLLVHAAVDGELDPVNALAVEQRVASDPALAGERARVEALRRALRDHLEDEPLPPGLQARIRQKVGIETGAGRPSWRMLAASVVLAVALSNGVLWSVLRTPSEDRTTEAAISNHLRSLMAPQPVDIGSSDRHTVKPWFSGRIPQAPRVIDLSTDGFPLVGGRIDVVGQQPVPTLVYRRRQHLISLTAIPDAETAVTAPELLGARGYNVVGWTAGGVSYRAVSDLGQDELETFGRLFRDAPPDR